MTTLNQVYCKFGEASEAAQLLETELGNLLLIIRGVEHDLFSGDQPETAAKILERINKSTLGGLLEQIRKSHQLSDHLDETLANGLAERNRLIHSFFREHNFRRNTEEGCTLMIEDLDRMHEAILNAFKAALALSGIDLDKTVSTGTLPPLPTKHLKMP